MESPEEFSILEFHSKHVFADLQSKNLSFCDQTDETWEHYFVMGRLDEEPSDYADDLGEVYIERDDQCWGGYGGIKQVILQRSRFTIELGPRMMRQLVFFEIRVTFDVLSGQFDEIRSVLGLIMQGYESRVFYRD